MKTMDELLYSILVENFENVNGRSILFWGEHDQLQCFLEKQGFTVTVVTYSKEKVSEKVHWIEDYKNKSDCYYIVVPFITYSEKRRSILCRLGFEWKKDFIFLKHDSISLKSKCEMKYSDEFSNKISSQSDGITVVLKEGACCCNVSIGKNIKGNATIYITHSGVNVEIGDNVEFKMNSLFCFGGATLKIGNNSTFNSETSIIVTNMCSVTIGNDCMFSFGIQIHSGDGHAILDAKTGERLNPLSSPKNKIEIGNHVWIGFRTNILAPFSIGDNSIIGAGSLCKGQFDNNSLIVGTPSKLIKTGVTWDRNNY